jgi:hypothetical protein
MSLLSEKCKEMFKKINCLNNKEIIKSIIDFVRLAHKLRNRMIELNRSYGTQGLR